MARPSGHFILLSTLIVFSLVACADIFSAKPQPTRKPKPAATAPEKEGEEALPSAGHKAFFTQLYRARVHLSVHNRGQSETALQKAIAATSNAHDTSDNDSEIMAELMFTRSGALATLYVPLEKGPKRFDSLRAALRILKKQYIPLQKANLVTFDRSPAPDLMKEKLESALAKIQEKNVDNPGYAFTAADQSLNEIYIMARPKPYEDDPRSTTTHYLRMAQMLYVSQQKGVAKDVLAKAQEAHRKLGAKYQFKDTKPEDYKELTTQINRLDAALSGKKPLPAADVERMMAQQILNPNTEK